MSCLCDIEPPQKPLLLTSWDLHGVDDSSC